MRLTATPQAPLGPVFWFGWGLALAVASRVLGIESGTVADIFVSAFWFAVALTLAALIHALGHIVSGKLVGHPMDELLFTMTRDINVYHGDQSGLPPRVHLGRALGGPVANLVVALALLSLGLEPGAGWWHDLGHRLAWLNLYFGAGAFLPIPSVDGEVIWRELGVALGQARA